MRVSVRTWDEVCDVILGCSFIGKGGVLNDSDVVVMVMMSVVVVNVVWYRYCCCGYC